MRCSRTSGGRPASIIPQAAAVSSAASLGIASPSMVASPRAITETAAVSASISQPVTGLVSFAARDVALGDAGDALEQRLSGRSRHLLVGVLQRIADARYRG